MKTEHPHPQPKQARPLLLLARTREHHHHLLLSSSSTSSTTSNYTLDSPPACNYRLYVQLVAFRQPFQHPSAPRTNPSASAASCETLSLPPPRVVREAANLPQRPCQTTSTRRPRPEHTRKRKCPSRGPQYQIPYRAGIVGGYGRSSAHHSLPPLPLPRSKPPSTLKIRYEPCGITDGQSMTANT